LVLDALGDLGVDIVELGIPYGDPLADGPTIAAAAHRALAAGTTMADAFALASRMHQRGGPPIVFFTYANPVDRFGVERFAEAARASGAAGAIVPDVPLEETGTLRAAFQANGLVLPLLIAPTTPPERATRITAASTGFAYVVSRLGVTGARRSPDFTATAARVTALRPHATVPLCVGFGISSADDVRQVAGFADGAIVGSALIDAYVGKRGHAAAAALRVFVEPMMEAVRHPPRADQAP
jgi:tryptophan synthase alpha chain